jgi:glucose-1-phosphatase
MTNIKNIIFDLGGVIINLDIHKTIVAFNQLTPTNFETIYTQLQQTTLFDEFDKGLITEGLFFNELNKGLSSNIEQQHLITAWNAMLLDFPAHRLDLLKSLKTTYRIFLLSNTNETHIAEFEKQLHQVHGYKNLEPFFEKVYYSCRMSMRKPDVEIFEYVLKENNLIASETVFIDDTIHHVNGALKAGIKAHLLPKEKEVGELLKEINGSR